MLKIIYTILILIMTINLAQSDEIDLTKKPVPLEDISLKFPETHIKYLQNGIKVYLIEDNRQPLINIKLLIGGGSVRDGDKQGLAELTAEMMSKGAGNKSALDIAKILDGVGASISTSAGNDFSSIYISTLNKHIDKVLSLAKLIVSDPKYDNGELKKAKEQFKAALMGEKSDPSTLASKLSTLISFGEEHPYSNLMSEESIESIKSEDLLNYYKTYFIANNVSIAVSGDYKKLDIIGLLEEYFGEWKNGELINIDLPEPKPMPKGIYFIERPGSAQSTVRYVFKTVPYSSEEYEYLNFATSMISGGFSGRLFKTLREKYAYTYSPTGRMSSYKYANYFACGSDVRNDVTDSSINVIMEQVTDLAKNIPSKEEFDAIKKYKYGTYLMSLENTDYVMSLIQNAEYKGKRLERLVSYPKRLQAMTEKSINNVARKYFRPEDSYIVVVGNKEVKEKLEKFGQIFEYDMDILPMSGAKAKYNEISISVRELLENYAEAIGSEDSEKYKSITVESEVDITLQGQTHKGKSITKFKAGKYFNSSDYGLFTQGEWFDGTTYWSALNGNISKSSQKQDALFKLEKDFFGIQNVDKFGFECKILGEKSGQIVLETKDVEGEIIYKFNSDTYILESSESKKNTPMGMMILTTVYDNYKKFETLLLPTKIKIISPIISKTSINTYKFNEDIDDSEFFPKED